jgi:hypothetical protein
MEVRKTLIPGENGTKRYVSQYGERLICVRYRYDPAKQKRYTTLELIVEESPFLPRLEYEKRHLPHNNQPVLVQIGFEENGLRTRAKALGAKWVPERKLWSMPYRIALDLKLKERIMDMAPIEADRKNGQM